jgi:hypothetical protein
MALGWGGRANANNKIYAARDATDGIIINAATGRGVVINTNGGATAALTIASAGAATFSSTIRSNNTNGLALGDLGGYRRIQYDNGTTTFGFLTDANSVANIDAGSATFNNNVTIISPSNSANVGTTGQLRISSSTGVTSPASDIYLQAVIDSATPGDRGTAFVVQTGRTSGIAERFRIASTGAATFSGAFLEMGGSGVSAPPAGLSYGLFPQSSIGLGLSSLYGMTFWTGTTPTERMRITSTGFLKQSNTGTYALSTIPVNELNSDQNYPVIRMTNSRTSGSEEIIRLNYSNYSPNNASSWFIYATDSDAVRFYVTSAGGIGNYQANNVNLSDERTKKEILPLESYWDKFKAIEIVKFKYKDQNHDDFNIGVIAQQVEEVAPEFVDVDGWAKPKLDEEGNEIISDEEPLKSIYSSDLHHATIKVLQEAMAKIETLEAEMTILKAK